MEAKELRIGNYLQKYSGNGFFEVTLEDLTIIELGQSKSNPIPLTEEWLLKFGYKKVNTLYDTTQVFQKRLCHIVYFRNGILSFSFGTTEIKYVHSFQNAIFALTNQELTLNK